MDHLIVMSSNHLNLFQISSNIYQILIIGFLNQTFIGSIQIKILKQFPIK